MKEYMGMFMGIYVLCSKWFRQVLKLILINLGNVTGDIELIVASTKEPKIGPIREAFQQSFARLNVFGIDAQPMTIAPQPVGYSSAIQAADERINYLRNTGLVSNDQIVVAVEGFIAELAPEK